MRRRRGGVRPSGYRSRFEEKVAASLESRGIKFEYEKHSFELFIKGKQPGRTCAECGAATLVQKIYYTPDFFLRTKSTIIEAKGNFTAKDRKKAKVFVEQHPQYSYWMLFMRDNKLTKSSKTRYSEWCAANGINYSISAEGDTHGIA